VLQRERDHLIVKALRVKAGADLARRLGVSCATIRRDLLLAA
jgi:DeoR/GlpR family transcriptional regulator of sugar metabolism